MIEYNIFIVEDDPWFGKVLHHHLSLNPDYKVTLFTMGKECLSTMWTQPDLIVMDFSLPDISGDKLFQKIKEINPEVPVVIISEKKDISIIGNLFKMGVKDYLIKDESIKELLCNSILRICEAQKLKKKVEVLQEELGEKYSFKKSIIGQSDEMRKVFKMIEKAIKTNINISITGETGTGKGLIAKAIHYNSVRIKNNYVAVNMAAIPEGLIESDLFGHEKGTFTGAISQKIGKFEEANGGTIFLDEISGLDINLQSKLLRVLQERELVRLGGNETIKLDVRLIVATQKNLLEEVGKGAFREDLFFRIMGLPIKLPSLRERVSDILILSKHFLEEFIKENNMENIRFTKEAKEKLLQYSFPGNVRELKAIIELAAVICENNEIGIDDIMYTHIKSNDGFITEHKTLRGHTCDIIKYYLKKNNGDVLATAKFLDIGKSTIYKMKKEGELF
ncbi:sigma-54 dependent transcriptional regulator [Lutibacter sp.]|uniref:sigma-54-dependent transcriptional regulator n=1 Tax=Lutibacter sp. TaxID=1925666 RepID=UPI001A257A14|nr:sigma-54 dependent transcriptional regulator [Lutibacter sp.]MBI9039875.1 sigma-54-dependent Fis family transcriptional regulator [Lutibacter sp.]